MKCPVCKEADLLLAERQGVEIDYCRQCRGVWLDRGELDKIIAAASPSPANHEKQRHESHHSSNYDHQRQKKHKSLLGELFDF